MVYDSLLLNWNGNILSDGDKVPQLTANATLCIGLGGTGILALSALKGKVFQQIQPDNPGDPYPRYSKIQFLGIDADEAEHRIYHGNGRLKDDEFISIREEHLPMVLGSPAFANRIRHDPRFNWMAIDQAGMPLSPNGAGGIRQLGRYLLINHLGSVVQAIRNKMDAARHAAMHNSIKVYILSSLCGGTGSGCFLDVCYLVRRIGDELGMETTVVGLFFLPAVFYGRHGIYGDPAIMSCLRGCGYAALKELDYLMDLPSAHDWFEQYYGDGIHIRTQSPPVDLCNLISAEQMSTGGHLVENGFEKAIAVASDYVMCCLTGEDVYSGDRVTDLWFAAPAGGPAVRRRHGANYVYRLLGVSTAELSRNQINTCLATGFFRKFHEGVNKSRSAVSDEQVHRFLVDNQFTAGGVYEELTAGWECLSLTDIDPRELAQEPVYEQDKLPRTWANEVNSWLSKCHGIREQNARRLIRPLRGYSNSDFNENTLMARLMRQLWNLSLDPDFGPWFAAALLENYGHDLQAALEGQIMEAESRLEVRRIQLPEMYQYKTECHQSLTQRRFSRRMEYDRFKGSVFDLANTINMANECMETVDVLREFRCQVRELYERFFRPLCTMLDDLKETFDRNKAYLETDDAVRSNPTWQMIPMRTLQPELDQIVRQISTPGAMQSFMHHLLTHSDEWLSGDQNRIVGVIREYMLNLIPTRSMDDYLNSYYGITPGAPGPLANTFLPRLDHDATPMFDAIPEYSSLIHGACRRDVLLVPHTSPSTGAAVAGFTGTGPCPPRVFYTGHSDRITALRVLSGVPLYAYWDLCNMKTEYDRYPLRNRSMLHLYAHTGRGTDGSGHKDWKKDLPEPIPYSWDYLPIPQWEELEKLYHAGRECGIIGCLPDPWGIVEEYGVFFTPELDLPEYSLQDFMADGEFQQEKYEWTLEQMRRMLSQRYAPGAVAYDSFLKLKNDGDPHLPEEAEQIRIDNFIHAPVLQKTVRTELSKYWHLREAISRLEQLPETLASDRKPENNDGC